LTAGAKQSGKGGASQIGEGFVDTPGEYG